MFQWFVNKYYVNKLSCLRKNRDKIKVLKYYINTLIAEYNKATKYIKTAIKFDKLVFQIYVCEIQTCLILGDDTN